MKLLPVIALAAATLLPCAAQAYNGAELLADCRAAEETFDGKQDSDPTHAIRSTRCISYLSGFADSYAVSDYLASQVGIKLNAFCLPHDPELARRLVRAVVIHVERIPPQSTTSTATLVAGALSKAFPCPETLEPKK